MKFTPHLTAAVLVVVTLASPLIATAHATSDEDDFIRAVSAFGISGSRSAILNNAHNVCDLENQGYNGTQIAASLYETEAKSFSADNAVQFVVLATDIFCPDNDHRAGHQVQRT